MKKALLLIASILCLSACDEPNTISYIYQNNDSEVSVTIKDNDKVKLYEIGSVVKSGNRIISGSYQLCNNYQELQAYITWLKENSSGLVASGEPGAEPRTDNNYLNTLSYFESISETKFEKYKFIITEEWYDAPYNLDRYAFENIYYKDGTVFYHCSAKQGIAKSIAAGNDFFTYYSYTFFIDKRLDVKDVQVIAEDNYTHY